MCFYFFTVSHKKRMHGNYSNTGGHGVIVLGKLDISIRRSVLAIKHQCSSLMMSGWGVILLNQAHNPPLCLEQVKNS